MLRFSARRLLFIVVICFDNGVSSSAAMAVKPIEMAAAKVRRVLIFIGVCL
jgi:hypothetical protein